MRALLQLSKRLSRTFVFSSSSYSSLTSSRTFATLTLFSPDCHGAAITTNGNVYARPWFAIQHRGVKVNAIHLRPGNVIEKSGRIFEVVDAEHKQRGRGGAILTLELRDVDSGNKQTFRFGAEEAVERVFVEERSFTCLYTEHESVYLMDLEKFEQLEVPLILFGQAAAYLKGTKRLCWTMVSLFKCLHTLRLEKQLLSILKMARLLPGPTDNLSPRLLSGGEN
ncbi:uncharacterized protein LOC133699158 isoform X2 [Populus nigra]|uniref:uncharacterized protein LOC133699158 isoform X2 n=1 Tax=Populus nigra TaxID=3691 RepID=UPI002B277F3E|nr:uncharacterized protein LOC133699158 isoform X2 [Populus nigra]